jgi:SAM-dependent methyltransferase
MTNFLADHYDNPVLLARAEQSLTDLKARLHEAAIPLEERIIDFGCGTGTLTVGLAEEGWQMAGVDYSDMMLNAAKDKARQRGVSVEYLCVDMRYFIAGEPAAAAVAYEVLNHFTTPQELGLVLQAISRSLKPGGLFLFDLNTFDTYKSEIWNFKDHRVETDSYIMVVNGEFTPADGKVAVETKISVQTDKGIEHHNNTLYCQYYSDTEMMRCLGQAGFGKIRYSQCYVEPMEGEEPEDFARTTRWECVRL